MALEDDPALQQGCIDLRSDTVTKPTSAMREAMLGATVGDDVLGDDPTVCRLEAAAAARLGKEAALFVPSGTMANLVALMVHCKHRGAEVLLGADSHICMYEGGGVACVAHAHPRQLPNNPDGTIDLALVEKSIRPDDVHFPRTAALCLENTHNKRGGQALAPEYIDEAGRLCMRHGIKLHIDGARMANACVALGCSAARMVQAADSVSLCLSKGLGAPAGSVVAGSAEFIAEARRARKVLGGGLRQVGVLAAPALLALSDEHWERLQDDHAKLAALHKMIAQVASLEVPPMPPRATNMLYVGTGKVDAKRVCHILEEKHKVRVLPVGPHEIRMVANYMVKTQQLEGVAKAFEAAVAEAAEAQA